MERILKKKGTQRLALVEYSFRVTAVCALLFSVSPLLGNPLGPS